jgi:hypothetical protein
MLGNISRPLSLALGAVTLGILLSLAVAFL